MIKIKFDFKSGLGRQVGKQCFIYRGPELKKIKKELGREDQNLCLKVFYDQDKPGNWGDEGQRSTTIKEATFIQNICWYKGIAPRVYKLMKVS